MWQKPGVTHLRVAMAAAALAGAPAVARAELEPLTMPGWRTAPAAVVRVDYLGATGEVHGVATTLGYRRPVSPTLELSGEAGVQWAARAGVDGVSLSNVGVGARYRPDGLGGLAVRVAATVPLASGGGGEAALPGVVHGGLRIADGERFAAGLVTGLVAAGLRLDRARAFAQAEAGVLLAARRDADDEAWLQLGLAGGIRAVGPVALVAELTTRAGIVTGPLPAIDAEPPETFRHVLDLGLRAALPRGGAAARLQVPLDGALRARDVFVAGVEYRLEL